MKFREDIIFKLKYIIANHDNLRDYQIAEALGLSPTAYSNRKAEDSLPLEAIIKLCLEKNISINYLFSQQPKDSRAANMKEIDDILTNTIPIVVKLHPLKK